MPRAAEIIKDQQIILGPFLDAATEGEDALLEYIQHAGVDLATGATCKEAILQHYTLPTGEYDIARAASDLMRWPPVANRIAAELAKPKRRKHTTTQ